VILIATHVGADFDAFASMIAARRLHPGAVLFFPGSREESLRRMLEGRGMEVEEVRQRDIDPLAVRRLVLCDTRQSERLGVLSDWVASRDSIEILAYDHHPDSDYDLPVSGGRVDPHVGATSTLMVEIFQEQGLEPSEEEATLLLMGIYEDTGSLSYPTTHPRDLQAVAWLLEKGADLAAARRYALHSLDPLHLEVLYRMTRELEVTRIRGHRVGTVALELGEYVDELAPLVSRCAELFDLPLLVAFFGGGDRVTIIGRGEVEGLDLGQTLSRLFGGGGHATAAAGSIRDATAIEARERLLAALEELLPPRMTTRELMISRFVSIPAAATVGEAKERLLRSSINAAPVLEKGRAVGVVTRQLLDSALQHGLEQRPVAGVMRRDLEWVPPSAPAEELGRRMTTRHPRLLLVGDPEDGRPLGLVTRMDVLRHLHGRLEEAAEPLQRRVQELKERHVQVGRMIRERVPEPLMTRIETIAEVSRRTGMRVYLVGGFVRDLLLERDNEDIDLVVEGDGPSFATELARALEARVAVHHAFLTAVVKGGDFSIDVATARSEFYRAPAALPEVQSSALRQDLFRRDFTINTLALRLGPDEPFELIDFFGGQRDIKDGVLRVLHSLSFIDDPTRVLRAVRLEARLGFEISPETLRLIEVALEEGVFQKLSGSRFRDELFLLLEHPATAIRGLERLQELGVLGTLHPSLRLGAETGRHLHEARASWDWYRLEGLEEPPVRLALLMLLALCVELPERDRRRLATRLKLPNREKDLIVRFVPRVARAIGLLDGRALRPHEAHRELAALSGEELLWLMATGSEKVRGWVRRDLTELRHLHLEIAGRDLLAAGYPPGPAIGEALRATRDARLDGEIGPPQELAYALERLEDEGEEMGEGAGRPRSKVRVARPSGPKSRGPAGDE
jgi:tRNA nucleotidyltransferase (CCA-adding enzyme)